MCEIDFDSYCEVWRDTPRRARKEHTCDVCGWQILRSETYTEHFNIFDGDITQEKCCCDCQEKRRRFEEAHDVGLTPRGYWERLEECIAEGDDDVAWRIDRFRIARRQAKFWRANELSLMFPIVARLADEGRK